MKEKSYKITNLLSLTVFAVFALCVLLVLLIGARVYRDLVDGGGESYQSRTAVQYIATRVRQGNTVSVESFDGGDVLVIREEINGRSYVTRIYCHDGWLWELYCAESAQLTRADGEKVLELQALDFSLEDDLLTAVLDGQTLRLQLRGGKEVLP